MLLGENEEIMQTTQATQRVALGVLKRVVELLEKHNLKYVLYYGTLLGAIRHQGFIPWDDDIDIAMPRADYEKFKEIAKEELEEKYFVQDIRTDEEYASLIAKVRDSETTLIERGYMHLRRMNQGMFIDIFVTDEYKSNKRNALRLKLLKIYAALLLGKAAQSGSRKFISFFFNRKWLIKKIEKNQKKLSKGKGESCYALENRFLVGKDIYEERILVPFEDIWARIPKEYDKHLRRFYGDYMQLPPEEQRVPLHSTNHVSAEMSYKEYIEKYLNK